MKNQPQKCGSRAYELMQQQLQQISAFLPSPEAAWKTAVSVLGGLVWALGPLLQPQRI